MFATGSHHKVDSCRAVQPVASALQWQNLLLRDSNLCRRVIMARMLQLVIFWGTREDGGASVRASWTPYPTEPDLEAARAACERLHSETIFPEASTSGAPSWGTGAAAHTGGSLSALCTLLQKTRLIDGLDSITARCAGLQFATFNMPKLPIRHCPMTAVMCHDLANVASCVRLRADIAERFEQE